MEPPLAGCSKRPAAIPLSSFNQSPNIINWGENILRECPAGCRTPLQQSLISSVGGLAFAQSCFASIAIVLMLSFLYTRSSPQW